MAKVLTDQQLIEAAHGVLRVNCENLHVGKCSSYWIRCLIHSLLFSLKLYVPLNGVSVLFKGKSVWKEPLTTILNVLKASCRSAAVLTSMVLFAKMAICAYVTLANKGDSPAMLWASLAAMPASFIESSAKISEFSLYVMPRFLDAFWKFLKRRGLVSSIPGFQVLLFSFCTGIMSYASFVEQDIIKGTLKQFFQKFLGFN